MMDELAIERAVLSISAPGLYFGDGGRTRRLAHAADEYLAELTASEPRWAFGSLPLPDIEASIAEAEIVLERFGLDGVVIYTNSGGIYPGDERLDPLMGYLSSREAVVFVHPLQPCGQQEPPLAVRPSILEFVFESTRAAASLVANRTLSRFPGIRFILTHGGGTLPYLAERLGHLRRDRAVAHRNSLEVEHDLATFFYDVASCTRPHALSCLSAVAAPDHLLFGTDLPFETVTSAAAAVGELQANPDVAAQSASAGCGSRMPRPCSRSDRRRGGPVPPVTSSAPHRGYKSPKPAGCRIGTDIHRSRSPCFAAFLERTRTSSNGSRKG